MSRLLSFDNLHNTRDLGGMRTNDCRVIRTGLLFRSGHLSGLVQEDADRLSRLVCTIVDLRTDGERANQPDTEIPGIRNIHIPIVADLTAGISREEEADRDIFQRLLFAPAEAKAYMCELYRAFAADAAVNRYRHFLNLLAETEGGVLWHCTAGKDRAGIASVIVEELLGIPREAIMEDYLKTNAYLERDIGKLAAFIKKKSGTDSPLADQSLRYLFGADEAYLRAYYDAVETRFGSFDGMAEAGLCVTGEMRTMLRERYLEDGTA